MTFSQFTEFVKRQTLKKFEKTGAVIPVFLVINQDETMDVIPLNSVAFMGKEAVSGFLRDYCDTNKPLYTAHVAEANVVRFNKPDQFNKHLSINEKYGGKLLEPMLHPDKEDMLLLSFCSHTGERHITVYRVIDPVLTKRKLEYVDSYDLTGDDSGGLFANII
jgi:hypothetical protein